MKPTFTPLSKLLANPSKIARALDWQRVSGSVLVMTILRDRIDLAVASHPSQMHEMHPSAVHALPSIPIISEIKNNKPEISPRVSHELQNVMEKFHVCGTVVNWPVQREGWCGAPCGRVLYTLDQVTSSSAVLNKPICLWDEEHHDPPEDDWGRSRFYTETCHNSIHHASKEQYEMPSPPAMKVWNDFCRSHWPELSQDPSISSHPSRLMPSRTRHSDGDTALEDNSYSTQSLSF